MANPKPIQDVAHPNKSAPSSNSKSVIVTNRARVQDPMVNTDPKIAEAEASPNPSHDSGETNIQPLTAPVLTPAAEPVDATEPVVAKHVSLELKPMATSQAEEKPDQPDEPETSEAADTPEDPSEAKDAKKDPTAMNQNEVDEEQLKAEAALQKLVDSKQYFLPINTLESRRSKRFITFGILLSLLLVLAWADIALDAHLITIDGVKPLTNFFST